jgi:hypothetical protein
MKSELIKPNHLDRKAVVYIRQSSLQQVINNQESLRLQYAKAASAASFLAMAPPSSRSLTSAGKHVEGFSLSVDAQFLHSD